MATIRAIETKVRREIDEAGFVTKTIDLTVLLRGTDMRKVSGHDHLVAFDGYRIEIKPDSTRKIMGSTVRQEMWAVDPEEFLGIMEWLSRWLPPAALGQDGGLDSEAVETAISSVVMNVDYDAWKGYKYGEEDEPEGFSGLAAVFEESYRSALTKGAQS